MNSNVAALNIQTTVATIVAQILHPRPTAAAPSPGGATQGGNTNGGSPALSGGGGIILTPLFPQTDRPVPMDINLNQLLNTATLKSPLSQLPAELLARPQVIEAVVLRNTLLPGAANPQPQTGNPLLTAQASDPTLSLPTSYRVSLQWQNRVLQFISPLPLPTGRTVQLQINARGEVLLLPPATLDGTVQPTPGQAQPAATSLQQQSLLPQAQTAAAQPGLQTAASRTATAAQALRPGTEQLVATAARPTPQQTMQQSLREALPRQQALHTLIPLLQKLIAPNARAPLPEPIAKGLGQLLQSLPKPAQLQTGDGVKRALENSGSFLESRIVRSAVAATAGGAAPEPVAKVLETDLKAQLTALLGAVRKLLPNGAATAAAVEPDPATQADDLIYNPRELRRNNATPGARDNDVDAGDLQLAQLGKLLQSGLARIQLNQLDGAVSRHASADPQLLVPAWVLELPMPNARGHSDNLQLRIEQRGGQQQARTRVQWNVQIAFDLHELGKIAATLSIVDKNVAATVWAEQANTHRSVQQKIDYLRAGLESVGVKVTEMQCRHGLPPARTALISQQLVDVHT